MSVHLIHPRIILGRMAAARNSCFIVEIGEMDVDDLGEVREVDSDIAMLMAAWSRKLVQEFKDVSPMRRFGCATDVVNTNSLVVSRSRITSETITVFFPSGDRHRSGEPTAQGIPCP
jgi:hypothetical protein